MEGYTLKKWESTLNLCVHAHGHDVDPIMEASCNSNYFLDMISSSICVLILLQSWFRPCSPLNTISGASLSICLLQSNTPVQPLLWSVVEYYPPGISRLSWNCITPYEFFIKCYLPTDSNFSRALSYWTLKNTDNWTESALRFNNFW